MGLEYNEENYVPRGDPQYYDQISTTLENETGIFGRSGAFQSEKWAYVFSATGSYILPVDIILFSVILNCNAVQSGGPTTTVTVAAAINGVSIGTCTVQVYDEASSNNVTITIPNWRLNAGTTISASNGGSANEGRIIFIGYLA